jgi:ADP-ribose pyrophosphatase YjhB (NUDIX family)
MNFCSRCSSPLVRRCSVDESRERLFCDSCGEFHYLNPKVLIACVAYFGNQLLMCRRAREPDHGLWEVPSGFVENGESLEEATIREVAEETGVRIVPEQLDLYSVLSLPKMNQVYVVFRAELSEIPTLRAGPESVEVAMKLESDMPLELWAFEGGVCGGPGAVFREIRTREFAIRKLRIGDPALHDEDARVYAVQSLCVVKRRRLVRQA